MHLSSDKLFLHHQINIFFSANFRISLRDHNTICCSLLNVQQLIDDTNYRSLRVSYSLYRLSLINPSYSQLLISSGAKIQFRQHQQQITMMQLHHFLHLRTSKFASIGAIGAKSNCSIAVLNTSISKPTGSPPCCSGLQHPESERHLRHRSGQAPAAGLGRISVPVSCRRPRSHLLHITATKHSWHRL